MVNPAMMGCNLWHHVKAERNIRVTAKGWWLYVPLVPRVPRPMPDGYG